MKTFRFRLDPVLTLRNWEEERARSAYELAVGREEAVARVFRAVAAQIEADLADGRREAGTRIVSSERTMRWKHLQAQEEERARQAKNLQAARRVREEKMKALIEAHRRVRILEQLRVRRLQAHLTEGRRREEKEIDEVINARFQPDL